MKIFLIIFFSFFFSYNVYANYKMLMFSYDHQTIPGWSPHTFALFYETTEETNQIISSSHISWLPATSPADVEVFAKTVKGKNYSLQETLNFAIKNNKKLMFKGPFIIKKSLFDKALKQEKKLNSGSISYKVLDTKRKGNKQRYHCVYAVSDIISEEGLMSNWMSHTKGSMERIEEHFSNYILRKGLIKKETINHFNLKPFLEKMEHIND